MNVLIVDECDCNRTIVRGLLRSLSVGDIAEASNAAEASVLLDRFDVALAVINAAVVSTDDGAAIAKRLGHPPRKHGLIILQNSPDDATPDIEGAIALSKPFSRASLTDAVHRSVHRKRAA